MINIIIVSDKMSKTRTLSTAQTLILVLALALLPILLATILYNTPKHSVKHEDNERLSALRLKKSAINSQNHLDAYAKQIGELQARIMRLDTQNERLAKLAGIKISDEPTTTVQKTMGVAPNTNRGGPLLKSMPINELDLKSTITELARSLDIHDEYQGAVEARLLQQSVYRGMLPNIRPVNTGYRSSSYGWRIDPFTGHKHFHEGLDFPAPYGAPILAAADGIVESIESGGAYGNLLKVDHGSGLSTYYAHTSRTLVRKGEKVSKGQKIALVGSTGRSTGPHLHYEIRLNGSPLDPKRYLYASSK